MKTCAKCKTEKDESEFYKDKTSPDGLCICCKVCKRQYEIDTKDKIAERKRKYFSENKEYLCSRDKEYKGKNKEKRKTWERKYRESTREARRVYEREYVAKRKLEDPLFLFQQQARSLLHRAFNRRGFQKSHRAHTLFGCSYSQLMQHLGPKPSGKCHLDHICPISQARTEEEVYKLQHYSNLQWLSAHENLSKSDSWTPAGAMLHLILLGREWPEPPTTEKA